MPDLQKSISLEDEIESKIDLSKGDFFQTGYFFDTKNNPKPFVKWVGGKRQLLEQYKTLYPPINFKNPKQRYFEPFVGGGAIFFNLLPKKSFLYDLNDELITTYKVIKNDVENLIDLLKKHEAEKDYFLKIRAIDKSFLSDLEIASRFIYLNRTCFNGLYRVNRSGGFNVPFGKYKNPLICDEKNLLRVSVALKNAVVIHGDYKQVLKTAKQGDFIYFDPPYYPVSKTAFTSYTSQPFLKKEQVELRDTFLTLHRRGCLVMLSNSDTPFIHQIYSKYGSFRITKVLAGRAINSDASKRGKINELVITNY